MSTWLIMLTAAVVLVFLLFVGCAVTGGNRSDYERALEKYTLEELQEIEQDGQRFVGGLGIDPTSDKGREYVERYVRYHIVHGTR